MNAAYPERRSRTSHWPAFGPGPRRIGPAGCLSNGEPPACACTYEPSGRSLASGATAPNSSPAVCRPRSDGTPRALELTSPKIDEREVGLVLLDRCQRHGGETLLGEKAYAGRQFAVAVAARDATIVRPRRSDEPGQGPQLAPIRQRIESIFWTCKDLLTLERHSARTLAGLRARVLQRCCCLAAAINLNHQLGRPSRALVDYVT